MAVKSTLLRYTKKEGCFAYKDEEGKTKDFWEDSYTTKVAANCLGSGTGGKRLLLPRSLPVCFTNLRGECCR